MDTDVEAIISAATDIAKQYNATLMGHCAIDTRLPVVGGPEVFALAGQLWAEIKADAERLVKQAKATFDSHTAGQIKTEWREGTGDPTRSLVKFSRAVDLILMSETTGSERASVYRSAKPGRVVLQSGRPVLLMAEGSKRFDVKKVVVLWKDTREARRAIADAMPVLSLADDIVVVAASTRVSGTMRESAADVLTLLAAHGINAASKMIECPDDAIGLMDFIDSSSPDVVVSGGYGHTQVREWLFGGVTRVLLDSGNLNRFMSS